ncbi:MAG: efflux RND transporter periplasmic adaptor subunit [Ignavibacteriaceae bacterium]|nr:efflux RND transporter periplasmic adaptor subunit [Ignavibacteriaceae bacterium]
MKKKIVIPLVILAALIVSSYYLFFTGDKREQQYTFTQITRGSLSQTITATGTLQAVTTVDIGTQVSGKIAKLYVDFNDHVRKGQLLAVIDTTTLVTQVNDGRSNLEKAKASYHQAQVTDEKNKVLYQKNYISELDYLTSQTNVESALADMKAAQSALDRAITNLGYAYIFAPISGVIQNRAVEAGQTVAASLSAPVLFTIAEDLDKMEILASIDESDIGQIVLGQKVDFSVQAYPDKKFWGTVVQKRINSAVVSNVVNYTVVVNSDNKDHFLLPGMTATMDFYIQEKDSVLVTPNLALRFTPTDDQLAEYTKEQAKLNGGKPDTLKKRMGGGMGRPTGGQTKSQFGRLWYLDQNGKLQMSPVVLGITDGKNTEIVRGRNVKEGMQVISGIQDNSTTSTAPKTNSLIPGSQPQRGPGRI